MKKNDGPIILIQATDLVDSHYFAFTLEHFNIICSDWSAFPVSRAVTASSSFPGAFTPIVLKNYSGQCGYETPPWVDQTLRKRDITDSAFRIAQQLNAYTDAEKKPFIYLLDGGIFDNLGIRGPTEIVFSQDIGAVFAKFGIERTRKIAFIIVNAEVKEEQQWNLLGGIPDLLGTLGLVSSTMVRNANYETVQLLKHIFKGIHCENDRDVPEIYIAELNLRALEDPGERDPIGDIPTSLSLPEADVDRLRKAAEKLLFASDDFRRLVVDLGGRLPVEAGRD
jgi:NTE family protein